LELIKPTASTASPAIIETNVIAVVNRRRRQQQQQQHGSRHFGVDNILRLKSTNSISIENIVVEADVKSKPNIDTSMNQSSRFNLLSQLATCYQSSGFVKKTTL